jgi:glutamate synthase domain-containing protein 2
VLLSYVSLPLDCISLTHHSLLLEYHWRDGGEAHINDPSGIASLQDAVREKNQTAYDAYSKNAHEQIKNVTLRGLLDFDYEGGTPIPIDQVEPWNEIVRRFVTGAMSYGSISMESHSALAIAMNRLGGKSNTGEGGEDAERSNVRARWSTALSSILADSPSSHYPDPSQWRYHALRHQADRLGSLRSYLELPR